MRRSKPTVVGAGIFHLTRIRLMTLDQPPPATDSEPQPFDPGRSERESVGLEPYGLQSERDSKP
jgi:hypothetical protein